MNKEKLEILVELLKKNKITTEEFIILNQIESENCKCTCNNIPLIDYTKWLTPTTNPYTGNSYPGTTVTLGNTPLENSFGTRKIFVSSSGLKLPYITIE